MGNEREGFLPAHGNYRALKSFQKAEIVYDVTYRFCGRFLSKGDRTVDQMVQAARSGKQNIIEGAKAAVTSKETELKLTNVARASSKSCSRTMRTICGAGMRRFGTGNSGGAFQKK